MDSEAVWPPRELPPAKAIGTRKAIYDTLAELSKKNDTLGEVYFRKAELTEAVECSPAGARNVLRWLSREGFIDYTPGTPGSLSHVRFLDNTEGGEAGA